MAVAVLEIVQALDLGVAAPLTSFQVLLEVGGCFLQYTMLSLSHLVAFSYRKSVYLYLKSHFFGGLAMPSRPSDPCPEPWKPEAKARQSRIQGLVAWKIKIGFLELFAEYV